MMDRHGQTWTNMDIVQRCPDGQTWTGVYKYPVLSCPSSGLKTTKQKRLVMSIKHRIKTLEKRQPEIKYKYHVIMNDEEEKTMEEAYREYLEENEIGPDDKVIQITFVGVKNETKHDR